MVTIIDKLSNKISVNKAYIHTIWSDTKSHPCQSGVSLIYIYDIELNKEYVVNINNIDDNQLYLSDVIFDINTAYVYELKSFLNTNIKIGEMYDADLVKYLITLDTLETHLTTSHLLLSRKLNGVKNINNLIPIYKHIESIRITRNDFLKYLEKTQLTDTFKKIQTLYTYPLYNIERNGIQTTSGLEWTYYNIYTTTSRPSNRWNGVNYSALNKADGTRSRFVSRFKNGKLVQFDYDAYHPRIISKLIGYEFDNNISAYEYLASEMGISYKEAKDITFRQLYGGVQSEYMGVEYFKRVSHYIDKLWIEFNSRGYVETPILKRKLYKYMFDDINANKLFNYILQSTETEINLNVISDIHNFLSDKYSSKMVLYTYDSYLFDIDISEINILSDLNKIISKYGFLTKVEIGDNYNNLKGIDIDGYIKRNSTSMVDTL